MVILLYLYNISLKYKENLVSEKVFCVLNKDLVGYSLKDSKEKEVT